MAARLASCVVFSLLAGIAAAGPGVFNMPTTLPQCLGLGCGPGYHAHMVLRPALLAQSSQKHIQRVLPSERPEIYNRCAMYPGMLNPPVRRCLAPQVVPPRMMPYAAPVPAPTRAYAPTPAVPRPKTKAEKVPAEPASPGDVKPDELPLPKRK